MFRREKSTSSLNATSTATATATATTTTSGTTSGNDWQRPTIRRQTSATSTTSPISQPTATPSSTNTVTTNVGPESSKETPAEQTTTETVMGTGSNKKNRASCPPIAKPADGSSHDRHHSSHNREHRSSESHAKTGANVAQISSATATATAAATSAAASDSHQLGSTGSTVDPSPKPVTSDAAANATATANATDTGALESRLTGELGEGEHDVQYIMDACGGDKFALCTYALNQHTMSLELLSKISFSGIPDAAPTLRAQYWKVLLHYLPPKKSDWPSKLASSRRQYMEWKNEFALNPKHPLAMALSPEESKARLLEQDETEGTSDQRRNAVAYSKPDTTSDFEPDRKLLGEIIKDVRRTCPTLHFFNSAAGAKNAVHYDALMCILFIYAHYNLCVRYAQGMNDILAPLYYAFAIDVVETQEHAEADAFFCFSNLMSEVMDNYIMNNSELGIHSTISKFDQLLKLKDPEVWDRLNSQGILPTFYSLRWLSLLLSQEFDMPDVLRLWDSLFGDEHRFDFLLFFCCAMVKCVRGPLLVGSFAENMAYLQQYPRLISFDDIFDVAVVLRKNTDPSVLQTMVLTSTPPEMGNFRDVPPVKKKGGIRKFWQREKHPKQKGNS
ncbi:TBC1 domain family member 13 protein [Pelomyxa schiedti]|nr:TBC1 domain family member 13 protein [Pelomyxa schiedti]